jgi:RHS repeat-associated protein
LGNGTRIVEFGHQDGGGNPNYDRANNKLIEEKRHDPVNSEAYRYDSAYRLVDFNRGTLNAGKTAIVTPTPTPGALQAQNWTLDGLGNWTQNQHTTASVQNTENRTHSDFNEIVAVGGTPYAGGNTGTQLLDKNGNITDDLTRTYQWDALNRLRAATDKASGNLIATYFYDCHNRRMRKVVTNSGDLNGPTDFYYDAWRVMEEHDGTDAITQQYTYGNYFDEVWTLDDRRGGITIAQLDDGTGAQRLFYHQNTLYHVYALTDETGTTKEGYQYEAYGKHTLVEPGGNGGFDILGGQPDWGAIDDVFTVSKPSQLNNPYTYTGQRRDSETGLMYYKNRYLSIAQGKFLQRDPLAYVNGLNLYEYVKSNPADRLDPFGTQDDIRDITGSYKPEPYRPWSGLGFVVCQLKRAFGGTFCFPFGNGFGCGASLKVEKGQEIKVEGKLGGTLGKENVGGISGELTIGVTYTSKVEWSYESGKCEYCRPTICFPNSQLVIWECDRSIALETWTTTHSDFKPGPQGEIHNNCTPNDPICGKCCVQNEAPREGERRNRKE